MRIAFVADIHGNIAALEGVAADIRRRGVDRVVNLGDSLSGPLRPLETARFLMSSDWLSLTGDHDRRVLAYQPGASRLSDEYAYLQVTDVELEWLRTLPPAVRLDDKIYACHGSPRSDCEYLLDTIEGNAVVLADGAAIRDRLAGERSAVVACGHSHFPRTVRLADGRLLLNPGSVGLPAYTDDRPTAHIVETGSPDARYAILESTPHGWVVEHIALPYEYRAMAELARQQHRADWVRALLSGYVH